MMLLFSSERSTQQENCYTKQTGTNRIPVTATLVRVIEASDWNSSTKYFTLNGVAWLNVSSERNERGQLRNIKTNIQRFRRLQTG